jgi:MFS family permease
MPHDADTAIKVATSAGAIFGQCIFGYLGDLLGRKRMYGVELMIIIATTLAQSLCGESSTLSIVGVLIFYRVVRGQSTTLARNQTLTSTRSWVSVSEAIIPYLPLLQQNFQAHNTVAAYWRQSLLPKGSVSWPLR